MNTKNEKKQVFSLICLKEFNVLINNEFTIFKIGYGHFFIYFYLLNKDKQEYESIVFLPESNCSISEKNNRIIDVFKGLY